MGTFQGMKAGSNLNILHLISPRALRLWRATRLRRLIFETAESWKLAINSSNDIPEYLTDIFKANLLNSIDIRELRRAFFEKHDGAVETEATLKETRLMNNVQSGM